MLNDVANFVMSNWVEWLFLVLTGFIGWGYKIILKRQKAQEIKDNAISEGVQALLRDGIINTYNRAQDRGYCPIYEKESLKRSYTAYHNLDGNDVATELYHKTLEMDTERRD